MQTPYNWGRPTEKPGVYVIGGEEWVITWSPQQMHPYAAEWIEMSSRVGPSGRTAPPIDLWMYTLQVRDLND